MRKKFTYLLTTTLVIATLFTFAGCGKKNSTTKKETASNDYYKYVTLGDYKGLSGFQVKTEVSKTELKERIDEELESAATQTDITDRGAKNGDLLTIDYTVSVDGKNIEDLSMTDCELTLGNEEIFTGIDKVLTGLKKGDTTTVTLKLTDEITEEYIGKKGTFDIKVTALKKNNIPKYDEEFLKKNTDYKNKNDYEAYLKNEILNEKEQEYYGESVADLVSKGVKNAKFKDDYPDALYKVCKQEYEDEISNSAEMFGMTTDQYLSEILGKDDAGQKQDIINSVHEKLFIYAVAHAEKISVSDDDYKAYVDSILADGDYDSQEDLEKDYDKDTIKYYALYDNVSNMLFNEAKLSDMSEADYDAKYNSEEE